jgi:membrane fusion protein
MDTPLFRHEALAARSTQWAGSIVLARPIPLQLAAWTAAVLALALTLYLVLGEYTRKVRVAGNLTPTSGAIKVVAPQFGRVLERKAQEGDTAVAGQVMYELSAERSSRDGDLDQRIETSLISRRDLMAQEKLLQTQQLRQRQRSLHARLELGQAEIARLAEEIKLQDTRVLSAENMLKRYITLRQQGFVSELQLSQIENDCNAQLARRQTLERTSLASRRELLQIQEDAQEIDGQIHLNTAQAARGVASLDQEVAEHQGRSRLQVLAPTAGTVTALTVEPGQSVQTGATLATIIPAGSTLEAHLLVPSRAIGFIEPGQQVHLRLAAFPYQKFGTVIGIVLRVERSPIGEVAEAGTSTVAEAQEPVYRVAVKLAQQTLFAYGKEQQFRAGMTLEADIHQDRRRLIEWIIDPILSVARGHTK